MTITEKIEKLKKGIFSPETPENVKESMKIMLAELEEELAKPEPPPIIAVPKKKTSVNKNKLPHAVYIKENNIDIKSLPLEIRRKIGGIGMLLGRDSEKIRAAAKTSSEKIVEMIKSHLAPPPPPAPKPAREFADGEKETMIEKYRQRKARRNQNTNPIIS